MDILVQGLLSVGGQCQVAKDAPNFCSEWVSVSVFTLIVPLKVLPPKHMMTTSQMHSGYSRLLDCISSIKIHEM